MTIKNWPPYISSLISVIGFVLVITSGAMAYSAFKASSEARHAEAERRISVLEGQMVNVSDVARLVQINSATANQELVALRRDLSDLKSDLRELIRILQPPRHNRDN